MPKKTFRGLRLGDDVWKTLQAIKRARPRQFLTIDEVLGELERFYLEHHVNLADQVNRVLEGKEPLDEIVLYRVARKARPPRGPEGPPPP